MATLNSPGVAVTVIDESFYTPAEPGTTPLIVVATAENKTNGSGTGTALATTKAQSGKAFRVTSQRDLVDLFGVPFFEKTASGSPIHGGERNEYGLLAAYSYLGVSNSAFIVRADVDLGQLEPSGSAPGAEPKDGQWWIDTQATAWGIQEWNGSLATSSNKLGQKFTTKTPIVLDSNSSAKVNSGTPRASVGVPGDYAVVLTDNSDAGYFYKNADNAWCKLGSPEWAASWPTIEGTRISTGAVTGSGVIRVNNDPDQLITINSAASLSTIATQLSAIQGIVATVVDNRIYVYSTGDTSSTDDSTYSTAIRFSDESGTVAAQLGIGGTWYFAPALQMTSHTQVPAWKTTDAQARPTGSVWIKTTEPNGGARIRASRWNTGTKVWEAVQAPIYSSAAASLYSLDRTGGGLNLPVNALFLQSNSTEQSGSDATPAEADLRIFRRAGTGATVIVMAAGASVAEGSFTISEYVRSSGTMSSPVTVTIDTAGTPTVQDVAAAINAKGLAHTKADVSAQGELIISHATGGDIRFVDVAGGVIGGLFTGTNNFYTAPAGAGADAYIASNWQPLATATFKATGDAPLNEPVDGQLWYNPEFSEVDIMVHDGETWVGYQNAFSGTNPEGPIVAASKPTTQTDGTPLVNGDLWISTADLENFPTIYRWSSDTLSWSIVDKADQTTEDGVLFADARYGSSGADGNTAASIVELLTSDYLDPDAPDPALSPKGMLLWNTRRSAGNVKRYSNGHIDTTLDNARFNDESMADYATDRWVTASANQEDGSGTFGRKAQHQVVVAALKSAVDTSQEIRDEERRNFNLIACPGYPELLSNLINLNLDRGVTAFVVGDTPFRLASDATTVTNWGTNANGALDNNETGIVSYDEYCAVFYPNGFTTDLSGSNAVVPASHMMLRTIALSDQVSYPWFAPAGTRRGGITNATAVGYIDSLTGEFQQVSLNEGQRDVLYEVKVNPITFFNGVGLVNYGQKTRAKNASALDRINVARLTVYLRSQLSKLARPYVFEPNDKITRDEIKSAVESLLLELVSLRAIYDFAVVCDESNNTPSRIDRNELYVDVAIEPVKAVEFIYIPLRVKNTGEI